MKKIIPYTGNFPLSKAIIHNEKYTMEISGLIGINVDLGILEKGIENQTKSIMENIKSTLEKVGWGMKNIVKSRIFLINMGDYSKMNKIYEKYFNDEYPTRFALEVSALPAGALVEIECVAVGDNINL